MIVKQISIDIETNENKIDLISIIKNFLEQNGYKVLGISQVDLSREYIKILDTASQVLQDNGFEEASKCLDCTFDL